MLNKKKNADCLSVSKSALFGGTIDVLNGYLKRVLQLMRLKPLLVQHIHNLIHQQQVYKSLYPP